MPQRPIADDERQRVSSYLRSQGENRTWIQLWPRVVAGRIEFLDSISRVTPEQAAFKPAEDDWSIAEVALHVLDGSRRTADLVRTLSRGEAPNETPQEIGAVDPERRPVDSSWAALHRELIEDSVKFAGIIDGLPEPPSFTPEREHPFFGPLHSRAWYLFQRVHDQDHARQVAAIQALEGYPA